MSEKETKPTEEISEKETSTEVKEPKDTEKSPDSENTKDNKKYEELQKQLEALRKENEDYKKKEKEKQEAELSAQEKLKLREEELEAQKLENLRLKLFREEQLPPDLEEFITAKEEVSIKEQIKKLKERLKIGQASVQVDTGDATSFPNSSGSDKKPEKMSSFEKWQKALSINAKKTSLG